MTSKSYQLDESVISFLDSGGTVVLTLTSLGTLAGRQSAEHDLGATARAFAYEWRAFCQFATAPVVGETVDIYLKTSDGTHDDNDDGAADAALSSADKLKNLRYLGSIVVDEATADLEFSASGVTQINSRYIQIVVYNATVDSFTATAAEQGVLLKPFSIQGQDT